MEQEIEIINLPKNNIPWKRLIVFSLVGVFVLASIFFSIRAYKMTKQIIVSKSSSASPLLSGGLNNIERLEKGDRRINIVLLGMGGKNHPGGTLTDTIMVVSIDAKNKSVSMLSIPRDLYIEIKDYGEIKINSIYSAADTEPMGEVAGFNLMKSSLTDFLGVPIHYFVALDFDGFEKIIDTLGGVDINVEKEIYDWQYPAADMENYDPFYLPVGQQHLDGETALKYARSRHTSSDFDRAKRQQDIIVSVKEKFLQKENIFSIKKIGQLLNLLSDNLKTDLQLSEIESLVKITKNIELANISQKVFDDGANGMLYADRYDEMYVLVPIDPTLKEIRNFVSQFFKDPLIAEEKAKIAIRNGTNNSGLAAELESILSGFGYNIVEVSSADKRDYATTFIYDYSNGNKKNTLNFLKNYLNGAESVKLDEKDRLYDIEIIIGSGRKSF